jgi:diguanylate cyclase (GGDEF)-like protein
MPRSLPAVPRRFKPAPKLAEAVQWRLVEQVYADPTMLWASFCVVLALGAISFARLPVGWTLGWTILGVAIAGIRLADFYGFARRRPATLRAVRWRLIGLAWLLGAFWGSTNLVLLVSQDWVLRFWFINAQAAVLASGVARSAPVPAAARGYACLMLGPLLLICALSPYVYLRAYTVLVLAYLLTSLKLAGFLYRQTLRLLMADARNAALLHSLQAANTQLEQANHRLRAIAMTDGLTGIANRRFFDLTFGAEWGRAVRDGRTMSLLLIDIDHFKTFNDRFGHQAGDDCLRHVAACIRRHIARPGDCAARYGGEEFAVILPNTDTAGAVALAERIRAAVQALCIPAAAGGVVTISAGVACTDGAQAGLDPAELVAVADRCLYRAKREGRNRVRAEGAGWGQGVICLPQGAGVPRAVAG